LPASEQGNSRDARNEFNLPLTSELSVTDSEWMKPSMPAWMAWSAISVRRGDQGRHSRIWLLRRRGCGAQLFGLDKILNASCAALSSRTGAEAYFWRPISPTYWYPILEQDTRSCGHLKFSHHGQKGRRLEAVCLRRQSLQRGFLRVRGQSVPLPESVGIFLFDATTRFDATGIVPLPPRGSRIPRIPPSSSKLGTIPPYG
jgi:hypothetical protein